MILPVAFLLGGLLGWNRAAKRGGSTADKLQYGVTHGIAFLLAALLVTLLADMIGFV